MNKNKKRRKLYDPPSTSDSNSDQDSESDPGTDSDYSVTLVSNIPKETDTFDFDNPEPVYKNSKYKPKSGSVGALGLSRFTRKELILLGSGVGLGAIATLIGCIVALAFFSPSKNEPVTSPSHPTESDVRK